MPAGPAQPLEVQLQQSVETALEIAKNAMRYRQGLLRMIAHEINKGDIYVYVRGVTCKACGFDVKPAFSGDGFYCKKCKQIPRQGAAEALEPYLSGAACRFVLSSAGVSLSDPEMKEKVYEGTEGPYIDFEVWVTVTPKVGNSVRTFGNSATNDDFFAKRWQQTCPQCSKPVGRDDKCPEHGKVKPKREPYYLTLQEVDVPGVKQKAMTNAWNHAVRDLGLMPTVEHFKLAGVDISTCKRISFGKSAEDSEEFAAAASNNAAPQRGATPSASPAPAGSGPSSPPPAGADRKAQPPQARAPQKIQAVKWTKSGKGVEITWGGRKLYCFDNKKLDADGKEKLFDVIFSCVGQDAVFTYKSESTNDNRVFEKITGIVRLGEREWEDGVPVVRREPATRQMREPGEEG